MTSKEIMSVTTEMGKLLLEYGAEIYRAEESVSRISSAYGFSAQVFAIPSCLIVTLDDENGAPFTKLLSVITRETNLDRVDKLNNLSRYICSEKPDYATIMTYIGQIRNRRVYGAPVILASYAAVGATFALFFGGGWRESVTAGVIAVGIKLLSDVMSGLKPGIFFRNLICSAAAAAVAVLIAETGFTNGFDEVIIGSLMTLVPGVTLTNCMRDFIAGDFLAGLYTMTEALLTAVGMATGAAASIALLTSIFGG